eukprot:scaffold55030_cov68-Phaeocystis_antarctica.AAC.4
MRLNADASKFAPVGFSWPTPPSTSLSAFPWRLARARAAWRRARARAGVPDAQRTRSSTDALQAS